MAFKAKAKGFKGIGRLLRDLAPFGTEVYEEFLRLLRTSSRGIARLEKAVPKDTGRLSRSFSGTSKRGAMEVGSDDPAAPYIRYKRKRRYAARNVQQTLNGWARVDAMALWRRAVATVKRRRGLS